tara:strand:- start:1826 stop:3049 length:1224 start_codon:yes stop_codon:yes gene_type:complete
MYKYPRSAYIHIPFCHRRCFYCDFAVVPLGDKVDSSKGKGSKTINDYLDFLKREILSIKHKAPLSTIYIGGGTPSILNPVQIRNLIDIFKHHYGVDNGAEVTMEVDPASFNEDDLYGFINAGVNRFSLGVQSFNNQVLKNAGRRHTQRDVQNSCYWLYKAMNGNLIKSWSLDLIQNLPVIGSKIWSNDLYKAINFYPPHLSIYDLSVEDGTVFKRLQDLGELVLPDQDLSFYNSKLTSKILKKAGYLRYEISNYSISGHQSRHNRVYWKGLGWWAFGQGSTSSPWGIKFTRPKSIKGYKTWVKEQCEVKLDDSLIKKSNKYLDLDEKIMLGMRLREGVNMRNLFAEQGWNNDVSANNFIKLMKIWQKYLESGLLSKVGDRFFLSDPEGMELSNQILIDMFRWWDQIN